MASSSYDKSVRIWGVATGECLQILGSWSEVDWNARSFLWLPADNILAAGYEDRSFSHWDRSTWKCTLSAYAASGSNLSLGRVVGTMFIEENNRGVLSLACSPKGDQLAAGLQDHNVYIYDLLRAKCCHTLVGHEHGVANATWSDSDYSEQQVLSRCSGSIRIWDIESGSCIRLIERTDLVPETSLRLKACNIPRDLSSTPSSISAPVGIPRNDVTIFIRFACSIKFFALRGDPEDPSASYPHCRWACWLLATR